jgi:hypothetical protein
MLEAEVEREWLLVGTCNRAFEKVGDGMRELDLEQGAFDTGEIKGIHSAGSVALRYIAGRLYLMWFVENVRLCDAGRCVSRGSVAES